jgi:protein kinase
MLTIRDKPFARGGHSHIYRGELGGLDVAVKVPKYSMEEKELKVLLKLHKYPHHNVVSIYGICKSKSPFWTIMEPLEGDLMEMLTFNMKNNMELPLQRIRNIMHQLLSGLQHLHHHRIIHRDIKPENILIQADRVAITDFGIATKAHAAMTLNVVTSTYRAPEIWLRDTHYSYGIDVWAAGVIFYQLVMLRMPWLRFDEPKEALIAMFETLGSPMKLVRWNIAFPGVPLPEMDRQEPFLSPRMPDSAIDFIDSMLDFDKTSRTTAEEACDHEFFDEN